MKKQKITTNELSDAIGVHRTTFYRKINMIDKFDFSGTEIRAICNYLEIDSNDYFM